MEQTSKTVEKSPLKKDREQLVQYLTNHINEQSAGLVLTANWRKLEPFIELIGLAGVLKGNNALLPDEQLSERQIAHLRKMVAAESTLLPKSARAPRFDDFLQEIDDLVGPELAAASTLPADISQMPVVWRNAYEDTFKIHSASLQGD